MNAMRDIDIRASLARSLRSDHADVRENRIWSEFAVCLGAARVDVCLINGAITGYEIKSPRDNLSRLPSQVRHYGRVLDFAAVVSSDKHIDRTIGEIPDWWKVVRAYDISDTVGLEVVREGRRNPGIDPLAVAQLMWRDEAFAELQLLGFDGGLKRATRWDMWDRFLEVMSVSDLASTVRRVLKARPSRAADGRLEPSGGKSLPLSM